MRMFGAILVLIVAALAATAWYFYGPALHLSEAAAVLLTGSLATFVAVWAIYSQRVITRRQVTMEHIAMLQADGDLIHGRTVFRKLARTPGALATLAQPDQEDSEEYQAVTTRLNEFELISIGIQRGIIDSELYCKWYRSGTIKAWHDALPFIQAVRARHTQAIFREFENMVRWFEKNENPPVIWWWGKLF